MEIEKIVAQNIRHYRELKGLSQEALADKAGVNQAHISAIERGAKVVSLKRMEKIAEALEVSPKDLLEHKKK